MNEGQQKFFNYILERVKDGQQEQAKTLLAESFQNQKSGSFTPQYLMEFGAKMVAMLKPEHIEEVKQIMSTFGSQMTKH